MKQFTCTISHCFQCPNCVTDRTGSRWECKAKQGGGFICWDDNFGSEEEDTPYPPIPDWCPLPEAR